MGDWREPYEQAERNVPDAKVEPGHAAFYGGMSAAFGCALFIMIAGLHETRGVIVATLVLIAVGIVLPYLHFHTRRRAHIVELKRLIGEAKERTEWEAKRTK